MQWWYDFVNWLNSDEGWRVLTAAVIPAAAIFVAGIVAAMIGRGGTKRILARHDREIRAAAITAVVSSATRAARWNSLGAPEQIHADHVLLEADTRLRLLGVPGADLAADWSRHMIEQIKSNAVSFSFQAEQQLLELRGRLFEWQAKPARAKKLFKSDLESWEYEASLNDQDLVAQQHAWAAQQAAAQQEPPTTPGPPPEPSLTATGIRDLGFEHAEAARGAPSDAPAPPPALIPPPRSADPIDAPLAAPPVSVSAAAAPIAATAPPHLEPPTLSQETGAEGMVPEGPDPGRSGRPDTASPTAGAPPATGPALLDPPPVAEPSASGEKTHPQNERDDLSH